jgi:predicted DNA-binding transcriptional regulator AlpA
MAKDSPDRATVDEPSSTVLNLVRSQERSGRVEELLTAQEVAQILGVRVKRVYELGIPSIRLSERALRWRPSTLARWIEERTRS